MNLARICQRTLVYFGVRDEDEEELEGSLLRQAIGVVVGAALAGAVFGLAERDVVAGVFFGALWAALFVLSGAYRFVRRRRGVRRARPS